MAELTITRGKDSVPFLLSSKHTVPTVQDSFFFFFFYNYRKKEPLKRKVKLNNLVIVHRCAAMGHSSQQLTVEDLKNI